MWIRICRSTIFHAIVKELIKLSRIGCLSLLFGILNKLHAYFEQYSQCQKNENEIENENENENEFHKYARVCDCGGFVCSPSRRAIYFLICVYIEYFLTFFSELII